jgi:hypothetical protein
VTIGNAPVWAFLASAEMSEILGERDRAITRLEAIANGEDPTRYMELHRDFEMKALRTDPRFIAIARPKE